MTYNTSIRITCSCGKQLKAKSPLAGKRVKCQACGERPEFRERQGRDKRKKAEVLEKPPNLFRRRWKRHRRGLRPLSDAEVTAS